MAISRFGVHTQIQENYFAFLCGLNVFRELGNTVDHVKSQEQLIQGHQSPLENLSPVIFVQILQLVKCQISNFVINYFCSSTNCESKDQQSKEN